MAIGSMAGSTKSGEVCLVFEEKSRILVIASKDHCSNLWELLCRGKLPI